MNMRTEPYERALQKDNLLATGHLSHIHFSLTLAVMRNQILKFPCNSTFLLSLFYNSRNVKTKLI